MEIKTHPNFKSVYFEVKNADDMDDYVGNPLCHQSDFYRSTMPWEKTLWEDKELENFEIDLEFVDRLYYIYYATKNAGTKLEEAFQIVARMDYKGRKVYFELLAICTFWGFMIAGGGLIFVSEDPNLFMKLIMTNKHPSDLIYQSLREDGIRVEEPTEYDVCCRLQRSPPTLKLLCHLEMYNYKNLFEASFSELPKTLGESVKSFMQMMEAHKAYGYMKNTKKKYFLNRYFKKASIPK